jgi:hypothetical protein
MHAPRDPAVDLLPRILNRATTLARDVAIIHPADPAGRALAARLAAALVARGATAPECVADLALMPARSTPLPAAYRRRPLILLGNLNTNRALQPLYADFLCSTDADYPGGDGHDLRTIVNPYGTGTNVILAGGSSAAGLTRAVEKLLAAIATADARLALPFLLDVALAPELAANLAAWPFTPLDDTSTLQALRNRSLMFFTEPIRVIGAYTLMWSWTGDVRYAETARDTLRDLNQRMTTGYGDWHYLAERFMRAIPLLIAGGWLSDDDIACTDRQLLLTALGNADHWWRMREGTPPLGHRHQGKGTYEFLLLARYLRDQANPTPALRTLCDRWIEECCAFLDGLCRACLDDQDDESSLNNIATVFRYALGQERHEFFTSGHARLVARRCLALHDSNGNGAGQGGYGESQGMYLQQEATVQTACSAFYYGDGELKWILNTLPNLAISQRYYFLHYWPVFLQKFATGPELAPVTPPADRAIEWLPVTDHQFAISNEPPLNVEFSGHLVNALETWQLPEAVGLNRLPQARGFDKLVLRDGYTPDGSYVMIQGFQGGFRWQGHMQAANAIVRFFQAGHVWLVQNTSRHSFHDKNGLLISDGANATVMPPIAEKIASADFPAFALTVTRLSDYHHTDWTRHLFWSKAAGGCFVVIDRVAFQADGPYSLTCTWRTPGYAALSGRRWQADQGTQRFSLVSSDHVPATCEVDTDQGACEPYVLRQRRAGSHRAGDEASFQNLFYVRPQNSADTLDLQRLDERSAVLLRAGNPVAWCAAELTPAANWIPGARAQAVSAWVESGALVLAGVTSFTFSSFTFCSEAPVSLLLDLTAGTLQLEGDDLSTVTLTIGDTAVVGRGLRTPPSTCPLPAALVSALTAALNPWLATLRPTLTPPAATPTSPADSRWRSGWSFDAGTRVPERLRHVCVTTDPQPVDGSPDQLLDPVMPDGYSREIWRQWPQAEAYTFTLRFPAPQAVTTLNILGDCFDDPTLRTFNPLPEGITVELESADGPRRACTVSPGPDRRYKRYRDAENRLEVQTAAINAPVRSLQVRVPGPDHGRPFVLHRLEVLTDRTVAPAITQWITADLDGDGHTEVVFTNTVNELIVLDATGRERWRRPLANRATHLSAQPIDAGRPPILCVGLLGGDLLLFHADGTVRAALKLAEEFARLKDCLFGWYSATHCLSIWQRDAQGRGSLVVGGYAILLFLNADGKIVGHSFSDGPWNYDILVAPESRADRGDLYVRCGWNHGIQYYQGVPGDGPSGEAHSFGGFIQPMFRMLKRVIPFLNGRSLAAAWIDVPTCPEGALFSATELGCGVLSTRTKDWLWKLEGGMSLNACTLGQLEGRPVALTAGADGFVTAVALADGRVIRAYHAGDPVVGVSQSASGELLVATRTGVQVLDAAWQLRSRLARPLCRALPTATGFLITREDHTLELLELTS